MSANSKKKLERGFENGALRKISLRKISHTIFYLVN